jgi:hypothetical protein
MTRLLWWLVTLVAMATATCGSAPAYAGRLRSPTPTLRAAPRMGFAPLQTHVMARLDGGDETEEWYCPALEWSLKGVEGTTALRESDCPAFDKRDDYPRSWSRDYTLPAGEWTVVVRFMHGTKVVGVAEAEVHVLGGEQ